MIYNEPWRPYTAEAITAITVSERAGDIVDMLAGGIDIPFSIYALASRSPRIASCTAGQAASLPSNYNYGNYGSEFLDDAIRMEEQALVRANPIHGKPRVGSANKVDSKHAFPDIIDNAAIDATHFKIPTKGPGGVHIGDSELYQLEGGLGKFSDGIYEWIVDGGKVTHRRYIPGGRITGFPNQSVR